MPADHRDAHQCLHNLCNLLMTLYNETEDIERLAEAREIAERVIEGCPRDHPNRTAYWNTTGLLLRALYAHSGETSYLDQAIWIAEEVIDDTDEDDPQRATRLINLGSRLYDRFRRTARIDLDKPITHY